MSEPWYKDGLRFKCKQCGRCCTGEPGYVWVQDEDIVNIAKELGISRLMFETTFVRHIIGMGRSLIEFENGDCCLFDSEKMKCQVYESRPIQCRTWPFWKRNTETQGDWKKTAKFCPGCDKGQIIPKEVIESESKKIEI